MSTHFAYYDPTKSTSGQRFYVDLANRINAQGATTWHEARVVLFNISVPLGLLFRAWLARKVIVLRVDGLYFDRLSPRLMQSLRLPIRWLVYGLAALPGGDGLASHVANFINQNWTGFLRILLADHIIYQSGYSRRAHQTYFPNKPASVVVNGADLLAGTDLPPVSGGMIRLVTIFDEWRPSKRVCQLISFVKWAYEVKGLAVELTLLGYTGRFAVDAPEGIKQWVETMPCFRALGRFKTFEGEFRDALVQSDMYLTFSYRDACPNVVVEAMAHGLPVVGIDSGGVPDIVGDAGVLIDAGDPATFFSSSRYDSDFPVIDFELMLAAVLRVKSELSHYRSKVVLRFETDLCMDVVTQRYLQAMEKAS